jgi:hypothetical protein
MISIETVSFNRSNFNDSLNHKIETGIYHPGFYIHGDDPKIRINVYFDTVQDEVVVDGRIYIDEESKLYRFCYSILDSSNMTVGEYLEYLGVINDDPDDLGFTVEGEEIEHLYSLSIRSAEYPTIRLH